MRESLKMFSCYSIALGGYLKQDRRQKRYVRYLQCLGSHIVEVENRIGP